MFASLSSFVGRQPEIDSLRAMLGSGKRLITLTGPGGIGKTRLAMETMLHAARDFADNVFFVPLDALSQSEQVYSKMANILGVSESGNRAVVEDLSAALAEKQTLVCMDNWEHVLDAAPQLANLLSNCPHLHVLATSREALRLSGEQVFPVHPLYLPEAGSDQQSPAIQLFVERARAVSPDFQLDESNRAVITEICSLLDGLPLAIELSAALLRMFSPQALLSRFRASPGLEGRPAIRLLSGGPRDLPIRQQTLRATIAWSYNLLTPSEQRLFRWLAVFSGGADLEAIEAMFQKQNIDSESPFEILLSLEDKNLLRVVKGDGEPRFRMLRTIQEYAWEQLEASGELPFVRQKHADYYLNLVQRAAQELGGSQRGVWLTRLDQENDNIRSVLSWTLDQNQLDVAYELGGVLWRFWAVRGQVKEGAQWINSILSKGGEVSPSLRANVLHGGGGLAVMRNDYETAKMFFSESLALREALADKAGMVGTHHNLGHIAINQKNYEVALFHIHECLKLDRELGDSSGVASDLYSIGWMLCRKGIFDEAQKQIEEGLVLSRKRGDQWQIALAEGLLGDIAYGLKEYETARQHLLRSKDLFAETGDLGQLHDVEHRLGLVEVKKQNFQQAETLFANSLHYKHASLDQVGVAAVLEGFAYLASERFAVRKAARLLSAAEAIRNTLGTPLTATEERDRKHYLAVVRNQLNDKTFQSEKKAGTHLNLKEAVQYAMEPIVAEKNENRSKNTSTAGLSARELDVLRLVAQGLSDAQVAERLVLSPRTVNAHLTSIYNKLGVNSRSAATRYAVEHGLA
jgi:predicted ATPase/DNA-binding CsgD family transcriptional regulator